jgi:hypothetical protein
MPKCPFCAKEIPDGSTVCPHCMRAQPVTFAPAPRAEPDGRAWGRPVLLAVLLAGAGAYAWREYKPAPPVVAEPEPVVAAPVTTTIAPPLDVRIADTASVKIAAGKYLAFPFTGDGRSSCRVQGTVRTLSGGDRTIDVFIVDRDGVTDLENGRTPRTYFQSGPLRDVSLDFNVDGRSQYTLVVSNTGSRGRAGVKTVRIGRAACSD